MLFPDVHLLMGRFFSRLNSGGNEEFIQLPDGRRRTYDDLSDHYNEIFYHPDHYQDITFQSQDITFQSLLATFRKDYVMNGIEIPKKFDTVGARGVIALREIPMMYETKRSIKEMKINRPIMGLDNQTWMEESFSQYRRNRSHPFQNAFQNAFQNDEPREDTILEVFGKIETNALKIFGTDSSKHIGLALYLGPSILKHSNAPNAAFHYEGKKLITKITEKGLNGFTDLRVNHFSNLAYSKTCPGSILGDERSLKNLMGWYYFLCTCPKCENRQLKSSLKCSNCPDGCVPSATRICNTCNFEMDSLMIEKHSSLQTKIRDILFEKVDGPGETLSSIKTPTKGIKFYENIFNQAVKIFHPYDDDFNYFLQNLKEKYDGGPNNCLKMYNLMKLNAEYVNFYFNNSKEELAETMHLAIICIKLMKWDENEFYFKKAQEIRRRVLGIENDKEVKIFASLENDIPNDLPDLLPKQFKSVKNFLDMKKNNDIPNEDFKRMANMKYREFYDWFESKY